MPTSVPPLSEILQRRQRELVIRLSNSAITDPSTSAAVPEAAFEGYTPAAGRVWEEKRVSLFAWLNFWETHVNYVRRRPGADATVAAVYVTWEPEGLPASLIAWFNFRPAIAIPSPCASRMRVRLTASDLASADPPHAIVAMDSQFFTAKGATTMYRLAGQDKALVESALGTLQALLRRDADIGDFSARSQRSRVPLVPIEDTELHAAVTLVTQRLALLLETAT